MIPRSSFVFDRQRIVVAGEDSVVIAFVIATLRRDGHWVTHAGGADSARLDSALQDCHLFITGSGISGVPRSDLIAELREQVPAVAVLCLADATRTAPGGHARARPGVTTLREPFTADQLRAAVRPLLPQLRRGSVLARRAEAPPLRTPAARPCPGP